jgi:hypothetical protein
LQYWTRDLAGEKIAERSTLQYRYTKSKEWAKETLAKQQEVTVGLRAHVMSTSTSVLAKATGPAIKSTMDDIAVENGNMGCDKVDPFDFYVSDLFEGVHNDRHPTGKGAQLLSRVIEHVRNTDNADLRLSQVADYARQHSIAVPHQDQLLDDLAAEDEAALERHKDVIGGFYVDRFGHGPN